jgi:hypothetical protein
LSAGALAPVLALVWRRLGKAKPVVAVPVLGHALALVYSTSLGGDFSFEVFGYDRFTAVSAPFLVVGVVAALVASGWSRRTRALAAVYVSLALCFPVFVRPWFSGPTWRTSSLRWDGLFDDRVGVTRKDDLALTWKRQGQSVRRITTAGATIATCAAGAVVYFSHRGAIDLLGKVDPHVARLPATATPPPDARCWRGFPGAGHNKEDIRGSFRRTPPDLSLVEPPKRELRHFRRVTYGRYVFWARKGSPRVRWELILPKKKKRDRGKR